MKDVVAVLGVRNFKAGYQVRTEEVLTHFEDKPIGHSFVMKSAYTPSGDYIGDPKTAYRLCKKWGIKPELRTKDSNVCSIGFSSKDGKWYGWSHRALYGFKAGSTCKKGGCHYQPKDKADFIEDCTQFWDDKHHTQTIGKEITNEDGVLGVQVDWVYDNKVKNEKLRSTISGIFTPYPEKFGRGEWTAKTLDDAKQMAMDFAEGVS